MIKDANDAKKLQIEADSRFEWNAGWNDTPLDVILVLIEAAASWNIGYLDIEAYAVNAETRKALIQKGFILLDKISDDILFIKW